MTVVVQIEGRDAIPVRAIPMLTDWQALSPAKVAEILSGDSDHWPSFDGLAAYRLHPDGRVVRESQRSWSSWIVRNLKAASEAIKEKQTSRETGSQQWRNEALALLPAGVFVWRNEFEAAHLDEYGPKGLRARSNPYTFQPATYALDYNPQYGPEGWQKLVSEGFEQLLAPAEPQSYLDLLTLRAFYGADTHDDHWLHPYNYLMPGDAAWLLCGCDPLVPVCDAALTKRAGNLETLLSNYGKDHPADRTWRDWHAVAREIEADYDAGFDYFFDEVVRPSTGLAAVESTQTQTVQPQAATPSASPKVVGSAVNAVGWTVRKPTRFTSYAAPLHRFLVSAHREGKPRPTARDVVEEWSVNRPAEIAKVMADSIDYYNSKGDTKAADLEAIRKAIGRMTSAR